MPKLKNGKVIVEFPDYDGPGIYKLENLTNGKVYIGSSRKIRTRLLYHDRTFSRDGYCLSCKFQEDIDKGHKFNVEILEKMEGKCFYELRDREKYYVELYNSIENGYNTFAVQTYDPVFSKNNHELVKWITRKL